MDIEALESLKQLLRVGFELVGEVFVAVVYRLLEAGYRGLAISRAALDNGLLRSLLRFNLGLGLFDGLFLLGLFGLI